MSFSSLQNLGGNSGGGGIGPGIGGSQSLSGGLGGLTHTGQPQPNMNPAGSPSLSDAPQAGSQPQQSPMLPILPWRHGVGGQQAVGGMTPQGGGLGGGLSPNGMQNLQQFGQQAGGATQQINGGMVNSMLHGQAPQAQAAPTGSNQLQQIMSNLRNGQPQQPTQQQAQQQQDVQKLFSSMNPQQLQHLQQLLARVGNGAGTQAIPGVQQMGAGMATPQGAVGGATPINVPMVNSSAPSMTPSQALPSGTLSPYPMTGGSA